MLPHSQSGRDPLPELRRPQPTSAARATSVCASPNLVPVSDPFTYSAFINILEGLHGCTWKVDFVVDIAHLNHAIPLYVSPPSDVPANDSKICLQIPGPDMSNFTAHEVQHLSMLRAVLLDEAARELLTTAVLMDVRCRDGVMIRQIAEHPFQEALAGTECC